MMLLRMAFLFHLPIVLHGYFFFLRWGVQQGLDYENKATIRRDGLYTLIFQTE